MLNTLANLIPQGGERAMIAMGATVGAAFSFAFGDVGPLLIWLMVFAITDWILGSLVAARARSGRVTKTSLGF